MTTICVHDDGSNAAARPVERCRVARHRARPAKNLARRSACRGCSRPRTTRAAPFPPAGAHRRRNRLVDSTTTDVGSSAKPHRPLDQPLTNRESEALSFHDPRFSHGSAARFITTTGVCDRTRRCCRLRLERSTKRGRGAHATGARRATIDLRAGRDSSPLGRGGGRIGLGATRACPS